jgi:hypothetical protein
MNIKAIRIIVAELNNLHAVDNPENIFEVRFDKFGDMVIDWQSRKAKALIKNLAKEIGLDYRSDFKIGRIRAEELPEKINTQEKILINIKESLEEYIEIAEIFIK